jgi:hypothetical protein
VLLLVSESFQTTDFRMFVSQEQEAFKRCSRRCSDEDRQHIDICLMANVLKDCEVMRHICCFALVLGLRQLY